MELGPSALDPPQELLVPLGPSPRHLPAPWALV